MDDVFSANLALMSCDGPQGALVYDHKMLWRANLYISESNDWNDVESHKWNTSDNDWNRIYDFDEYYTNKSTANLSLPGDGGQVIDIPSFTHSWRGTGDTRIDNRVAYEYNGVDSPFAFAFKMDNQKKLLNHFYTTGNVLQNDDPDGSPYEGTTAPGNDHNQYVHGNTYPYDTTLVPADNVEAGAFIIPTENANSVTLEDENQNEKTYYPYVPSLEDAMKGVDINHPLDFWRNDSSDPDAAGYGAGTDCLGFVKRSTSYNDSPYHWAWTDMDEKFWGEDRPGLGYPYVGTNSAVITDKSEQQPDDSIPNLKLVVPGDIFFYGTSETGGGQHILIVTDVSYKDSDTRSLTADRIKFIESVYYTKNNIVIGRIANNRILSESDSDKGISDKNWFAVRLKD